MPGALIADLLRYSPIWVPLELLFVAVQFVLIEPACVGARKLRMALT